MLPRQSLIWAVLRKEDLPKRLVWSLCATFLGVMCLSGDVYDLSPMQWSIVDDAILFYRSVAAIIEDGITVRHGTAISSYRHPTGWQAIERTAQNSGDKLIVVHVFDEALTQIELNLHAPYHIAGCFAQSDCQTSLQDGILRLCLADGACALHLCCEPLSNHG